MGNDAIEDDMLTLALSKPADYSGNFDRIVEELRLNLSHALGQSCSRDGDMNYSSSQEIELRLDKAHEPVSTLKEALFRIIIFISSKGKFFTVRCRTRDSLNRWVLIPDSERDRNVQAYVQRAGQFMEANGYVSLPQSVLSRQADDHLTRLDKLPASVFDVLFSEID